jgi:hypothetical protein
MSGLVGPAVSGRLLGFRSRSRRGLPCFRRLSTGLAVHIRCAGVETERSDGRERVQFDADREGEHPLLETWPRTTNDLARAEPPRGFRAFEGFGVEVRSYGAKRVSGLKPTELARSRSWKRGRGRRTIHHVPGPSGLPHRCWLLTGEAGRIGSGSHGRCRSTRRAAWDLNGVAVFLAHQVTWRQARRPAREIAVIERRFQTLNYHKCPIGHPTTNFRHCESSQACTRQCPRANRIASAARHHPGHPHPLSRCCTSEGINPSGPSSTAAAPETGFRPN